MIKWQFKKCETAVKVSLVTSPPRPYIKLAEKEALKNEQIDRGHSIGIWAERRVIDFPPIFVIHMNSTTQQQKV